jgi:hypothetical protein
MQPKKVCMIGELLIIVLDSIYRRLCLTLLAVTGLKSN